ncbi:GspH/FimT family pseudopilin [Thiohalomonas denitrificans]|uniref:GspH/FimT family pseudopilin n=1 Tax=Thiohalomonas denitrificans TaxID=415747 RepID=UPI0026EFDD00|nr:GspH/FimT family pseudopilin [Thiohalomonas denitrificans]
MRHLRNNGFTLLEMMLTLGVLATILAMAIPSFPGMAHKNRLIGTAEEISAQLQLARTEAIKRSADTYVNFNRTDDTNWCFSISGGANCDCSAVSCQLGGVEKEVSAADFASNAAARPLLKEVAFGAGTQLQFDPTRGTVNQAGHVYLESPDGRQLRVIVSLLGRVRLCSPAGATTHVSGYPTADCP